MLSGRFKQVIEEDIQRDTGLRKRFHPRLALLHAFHPRRRILNGSGDHNPEIQATNLRPAWPSHEALKAAYIQCSKELTQKWPEACRTYSEHSLAKNIKRFTHLQIVPSLWIGPRHIDLFVPAIGGWRDKSRSLPITGLVIEVDGEIHSKKFKYQRDLTKYALLEELGILPWAIPNEDIRHPKVMTALQELKNFQRIDFRARRRLWERIYVITLLYHASADVLKELFQIPFSDSNTETKKQVQI